MTEVTSKSEKNNRKNLPIWVLESEGVEELTVERIR